MWVKVGFQTDTQHWLAKQTALENVEMHNDTSFIQMVSNDATSSQIASHILWIWQSGWPPTSGSVLPFDFMSGNKLHLLILTVLVII
jgi:hypothetical protein